MVHQVIHFLFGNIVMAILTLTVVGLLAVGVYGYGDGTPTACAQREREMAEAWAQRKIDEAKMQRDWALKQARLRLNRRLRAARDHAEDVQLAARLFADEVHQIQDEWRWQLGGVVENAPGSEDATDNTQPSLADDPEIRKLFGLEEQ